MFRARLPEYMIKHKQKPKAKVVRKKRSDRRKKLGAEEQFKGAASYQDVVDEIAAEDR